jgi:hypothetical protein
MSKLRSTVNQLIGRANLGLTAHGPAHVLMPTPLPPPPPVLARPIRLPSLRGASTSEIARRVRKVSVWFDEDDSGSMYYPPSGDQRGVRYAVALSLIDLMRRSGGGRAGVIHWGSYAERELALTLVDVKTGRRQLERALTIPLLTLGGNNLPDALRLTAELTPTLDKDEQLLIFVIGDGIEAVTPDVHATIAGLPAESVHMLLVDTANGCDAAMEAAWRSCALGSFERLEVFDVAQLAHQIGDVFARTLGLQMPPVPGKTKRRST